MDRRALEELSREELIALAERAGVSRPRVLTKPELVDELISRSERSPAERARARGWLGRARDLLARVVEKGLNLPEAAQALRGGAAGASWPAPPPPLPTVTLAEIYAAQGHLERAIETLDQVLAREPQHAEAKSLRAKLQGDLGARGRAAGQEPAASSKPRAAAHAEPESEPASEAPITLDAPAEAPPAEPAARPEIGAEILPLDDEDLPDRYQVDEIVAIAVDPRTLYVYWEIKPTTLARARSARPNGELSVRLASVAASWAGPVHETNDVRVDELHGDRFLRDVTPGANLRISIGWLAGGEFEPFAVGMEVTAPRVLPAENVATAFGKWSPSAVAPFTRADPGGAAGWAPRAGGAPARTHGGPRAGDGGEPVEAWSDGQDVTLASEPGSVTRLEPGGATVTEEIRARVIERLRRTGASEFARDRIRIEERSLRMQQPGRRLGGASDLSRRGGASDLSRRV